MCTSFKLQTGGILSKNAKQASKLIKRLADCYRLACRFDVIALKPGNVSVELAGHDMVAAQFLDAARASAGYLVGANSIGEGILSATHASVERAGCNTNLGIVLLSAPLLLAARRSFIDESKTGLREQLKGLLEQTTVADAVAVYEAIGLAQPGGLGDSEFHDVADIPTVTLLDAMTFASERDRIAGQYQSNYAEIFNLGVPIYKHFIHRWSSAKWATVAVYLSFLTSFNDSHIERKFGNSVADDVRSEALPLERAFKACENPAKFSSRLVSFDEDLKRGGVNPGTSADLTVASLLTVLLQAHLKSVTKA